MDVNARILEFLRARGWSEYRLRKESKLPASTIANIFHRGTVPSITTLESICKAFNISLAQFFSSSDEDQIGLTDEQRELLEKWDMLSERQKELLLELLEHMR